MTALTATPFDLSFHDCWCGQWGSFGFGVSLRRGLPGKWYCAAHRADGEAWLASGVEHQNGPAPRQSDLFVET